MKSHNGIKTHECKICTKKFAGSSSLKVHMKTHADKKFDNKSLIFECNMCKMNIPASVLSSNEMHAYNHELINDVLICSNVASIIDDEKIIEEISDENSTNILSTVIE